MNIKASNMDGWFAAVIGSLDTKPLYSRIFVAIDQAIREGMVQAGDVLPTQRELAQRIGWPLSTVTRGYQDAVSRGLIRTDRRNGSTVLGKDETGHVRRDAPLVPPSFFEQSDVYDLTKQALISPLYAESVKHALATLSDNPAALFNNLRYSSGQLDVNARKSFIEFFAAHYQLSLDAQNLILTSGAQNALVCALLSLFSPGDNIGCEHFTYRGLQYAARIARLNLIPIEMDERGIKPDRLQAAIVAHSIKGVVCVPNYQNPTATTMSEERRREVASVAARHRILVIEDDVYGLLAGNKIAPIFSHYPEGTFLINGVSKALGPGLRVGVIICPAKFDIQLSTAVRATTWMPSQVDVSVIGSMLANRSASRIIEQNKKILNHRTSRLVELLKGHRVSFGVCCPHAVVHLPPTLRPALLIDWLQAERIHVEGADLFTIGEHSGNFIRINLTGVFKDENFNYAIGRIATALTAHADLL
ncbi:PLP-dependent aminotransferase family protein [Variovorax humicola]|uniref:PLP-dependent aminotransferase family protein n=1 Tax=Variovorax humicola TaxID=1769758 RepID=A0ABU8W9H9_9BURK